MRAQRVREAESRIEMQVAKWTAEGTVNRAHGSVPVNQGGTAEKI